MVKEALDVLEGDIVRYWKNKGVQVCLTIPFTLGCLVEIY